MTVVLDRATEEAYLALVHAFPLLSIRDDAHLAEALGVIDGLLGQPQRSTAEERYLGALTDLVETHENAHVVIPPTSGVGALPYLMAENGLTQADLVPLLGRPQSSPKRYQADIASRSTTSNGCRRLSACPLMSSSAHSRRSRRATLRPRPDCCISVMLMSMCDVLTQRTTDQ